MRFINKIVAITGACGGIGSALVRKFRDEGASIVMIDRDRHALDGLVENTARDRIVVCDQTEDVQILRACEEIGVVDVLVSNAGVVLRKPLFEHTLDEIDSIFAINTTGSIKLTVGVARRMSTSQGGRGGVVINVSTQHAFGGAGGRAIYAASKAAIAQFTKAAAVEWIAEGIRVCGIAPGPVASPMTAQARQSSEYCAQVIARMPVARFLEIDEIVDPIVALATPEMSAIVGTTLLADGGGTLS
ncbi:SDR family NAD(P)-dependent oxidoreductase [Candidimonas nitroreducens]|uniref:Short-chain dehydrogenase n=1 Tax=Candidimonas nitroreducens TaxID=683354 RepID=A0A225MRD7_9BURK|nr:SDR family oxidoreductase [Candidimonas nitroreducens]OWT63937.1 hypothetical protein CEY11_06445 [Candidimonas nitroreducens]